MAFSDEYICFFTDSPQAFVFLPAVDGLFLDEIIPDAAPKPAYAIFAANSSEEDPNARFLGCLYRNSEQVLPGLLPRLVSDLAIKITEIKSNRLASTSEPIPVHLNQETSDLFASGLLAYTHSNEQKRPVIIDFDYNSETFATDLENKIKVLSTTPAEDDVVVAMALFPERRAAGNREIRLLAPLDADNKQVTFGIDVVLRDYDNQRDGGILANETANQCFAVMQLRVNLSNDPKDIARGLANLYFFHRSQIRASAGKLASPRLSARFQPSNPHPYGDSVDRILPLIATMGTARNWIAEELKDYAKDSADDLFKLGTYCDFDDRVRLYEERKFLMHMNPGFDDSELVVKYLFKKDENINQNDDYNRQLEGLKERVVSQFMVFLHHSRPEEFDKLIKLFVDTSIKIGKGSTWLEFIINPIRVAPLDTIGIGIGNSDAIDVELCEHKDSSKMQPLNNSRLAFKIFDHVVAVPDNEPMFDTTLETALNLYALRTKRSTRQQAWENALRQHFPNDSDIPANRDAIFARFIVHTVLAVTDKLPEGDESSGQLRDWNNLDSDPVTVQIAGTPNWQIPQAHDGLTMLLAALGGIDAAEISSWLMPYKISAHQRAELFLSLVNEGHSNLYRQLIHHLERQKLHPLLLFGSIENLEELLRNES